MLDCERAEYLGAGIYAYINPKHRFGTDALLLADFASPKKGERACDLGTGCGIIPLLWARAPKLLHSYGVEIDSEAVDLAKRSAQKSGMVNRLTFINADLRDNLPIENASLSLVTCNPPYFTSDSGVSSADPVRGTARHELFCDINDVAQCAARLLNFSGRLCVCQRPERLVDTVTAMRFAGIEPKKIRMVAQKRDKEPWLMLIEGRKGAKNGIRFDPLFRIYDDDGKYTPQMEELYRLYREEPC
ncbi:MAG: methyltransferase domain-containing protein [Clostridia bacterium]|nr:methyltransferase domain-containing protein [Clostridia bacterium]